MFNSKNQFKIQIPLWVLGAVYILKSLSTRIGDSDLWWHLATGRVLLENHTFLRTDVFSHTLRGTPWINFEWLGQVLFYGAVKWGGLDGIYYLKIVLGLGLLFLLGIGFWSLGGRGLGLLWALLSSFFLLRPRLNERIELFSLLFLGAFVFLCAIARYRPAESVRKLPWVLFGLMVLWCNLHGGFVYGLGVVILFLVGAYWSGADRGYISFLWWSLLLILIATMINPYGPRLFLAHVQHLGQFRDGLHIIEEWAPPSIPSAPFFWMVFVFVAATLIVGLLARQPDVRFWAPAVVVFLAWAAMSHRNMALLVFTAHPFLVDFISKWERFHLLRSHSRTKGIASGLFVLAIISQARILAHPFPKEKVQWNRFPRAACQFVRENNLRGPMYNTYHFGGYLEWDLGSGWPVFMDGRYLFHPLLVRQSVLNNQAYAQSSPDEWQRYLDEQKVDYAITNMGDFFTADGRWSSLDLQFPRARWALVFWDDTACVFVRRHADFKELISTYEYTILRPFNWGGMARRLENKEFTRVELQRELSEHKKRTGFTVANAEMEKYFHVE